MSLTNMASFKEARERDALISIRLRKLWRWRYLGGRIHVAFREHSCDYCIAPIVPGDHYRRDVFANYKYIKIEKSHWPECFAPSDEEVIEMQKEMERERVKRRPSKSLRKVA